MNRYRASDGERFSTHQVNRLSDKAAKRKLEAQFDEFGFNFCEECYRNDCKPIDVAHVVSRKKAKETGKAELCWDVRNMRILGRKCHEKLDGLNIG